MDSLNLVDHETFEEQFVRAATFLTIARNIAANEPATAFRLRIAALYFARAIGDQLLREAEEVGSRNTSDPKAGKTARRAFDEYLHQNVAYFRLVDYARLHDFHRKSLMPPVGGRKTWMMQGPIKVTSRQGGLAAVVGTGAEQRIVEERNSSVQMDRPIQQFDDSLLDDATGKWIRIDTILREYLRTIRPIIDLHAPPPKHDMWKESDSSSVTSTHPSSESEKTSMAKAATLRFLLRSNEDVKTVLSRFHPSGRILLNRTAWRGRPPRSCGVLNCRPRPRSTAATGPIEWEIEVAYRPKGVTSYVGATKYDGWTAMMLDRSRDGTLLDGHGNALADGQPPVYLPFEVHHDVEFNDLNFGELLGETPHQDIQHIATDEVIKLATTTGKINMSVNAKFVAPRRQRPLVKIILSDQQSAEGVDGFGTRIINICNSTPHLETALEDALFKLVSEYIEGRSSILTIAAGDFAFIELSDSLVDCSPNVHGLDSWFNVLKNYVPGTFLDELAKRVMAIYEVDVQVVDGDRPGLLIRRSS